MAEDIRRREMSYERTGPPRSYEPERGDFLAHLTAAGPLALAAFALPLFIWSAFNTHYFDLGQETFIIPLAVFFGGPVALAAGMWAYSHRDAFLATTSGVFGAFWLTYGILLWLLHNGTISQTSINDLRGLLFVAWAVTFGVLWIASMRAHWALSLVSLGAGAMFVLLAIGYYHDSVNPNTSNIIRVGGWVGFVTAGLAWYSALAHLLNAEFERPVLPTNMDWFRTNMHMGRTT